MPKTTQRCCCTGTYPDCDHGAVCFEEAWTTGWCRDCAVNRSAHVSSSTSRGVIR